jgi:hypothetical protein
MPPKSDKGKKSNGKANNANKGGATSSSTLAQPPLVATQPLASYPQLARNNRRQQQHQQPQQTQSHPNQQHVNGHQQAPQANQSTVDTAGSPTGLSLLQLDGLSLQLEQQQQQQQQLLRTSAGEQLPAFQWQRRAGPPGVSDLFAPVYETPPPGSDVGAVSIGFDVFLTESQIRRATQILAAKYANANANFLQQ